MKRFLIVGILVGAAVIAGAFWRATTAHADSSIMTEAHIQRIRANCVEAQSSLSQLHASDALLRVNRGQLYESISTKLMAPFNSRLALNHMDSVDMVSLAAEYDKQLDTFRTEYQQYEESMSNALQMNCVNQPVAFYDNVADARAKRKKVHDSTLQLQKTIQKYQKAFESFAKNLEGAKQ